MKQKLIKGTMYLFVLASLLASAVMFFEEGTGKGIFVCMICVALGLYVIEVNENEVKG